MFEDNPYSLYDKPGRKEATEDINALMDRVQREADEHREKLNSLWKELQGLTDKHSSLGADDTESRYAIRFEFRERAGISESR